jgi:hypothetical protein
VANVAAAGPAGAAVVVVVVVFGICGAVHDNQDKLKRQIDICKGQYH